MKRTTASNHSHEHKQSQAHRPSPAVFLFSVTRAPRMAVRFCEIWLLVGVVFVVQVPGQNVGFEMRISPEQSEQMYGLGLNRVLKCMATVSANNQRPSLHWEINDVPVTATDNKVRVRIVKDMDGSLMLRVDKVQDGDEGVYKCVATLGSQTDSRSIQVVVIQDLQVLSPRSQFGIFGTDGAVRCQAVSKPPPSITWKFSNGTKIPSGTKYVIQQDQLIIKDLNDDDTATYRCDIVVVEIGNSEVFYIDYQVIRIPKIDMIPTISPNNPKVGDSEVKITCHATGFPQPTYEFRKGANIISEAQMDKFNGILTINDVKREDEGNYTCVAENRGGSDEKSIYLDVKIAPVISDIPDVKGAVEGGQQSVTCMAEGDPAPVVIWQKQGLPAYTNDCIKNSGPTFKDEGGTDREDAEIKRVGKTMDFTSIKPQDAGTYTCTAINVVGNATKTIKFEVRFKPNFDTDFKVTTFYGWRGHTANLTCLASANEVATIKWYEIKDNRTVQIENVSPYTITVPLVWPDYYLSSSSLLVYVTDETSSVFQDYICEATNSLGSANQTVTLRRLPVTTPATATPVNTTEASTDVNTTEASTTAQTSTTSSATAQTVRQDFECHLDYMFVFIPVDLVPNSQLTLRDPSCRLINNGTHHKISLDYDECGTSQSFYEDYISVENDVNVHNIFNDTAEITFVEDYKIPLRCSVDRSKLVNGIQVLPRETIHESVVQSTDFNMKEFTTKDYNQEITEYPVKLPINREIFFEIALANSSSNSTGIFVEKCEATPSINPNDTVRVSLIHYGCSVIPAVKVLPAPGIDRFRFSIQAFHFSGPANVSNMVYVHCSASTCGGLLCDNPCLQSSRRRKRSARGRASTTLTSGSHVVS